MSEYENAMTMKDVQASLDKKGIPATVMSIEGYQGIKGGPTQRIRVDFPGLPTWNLLRDEGPHGRIPGWQVIMRYIEHYHFSNSPGVAAVEGSIARALADAGTAAWVDVYGESGGKGVDVFTAVVFSQERGLQREYLDTVFLRGPDDPSIGKIVEIAATRGEYQAA